jgi:hypothetical protein
MRMKRILSLVIMLLYLLPATGMTVSTHYCGGKLADVSFFGAKTTMNCSCGTVPPEKNVQLKRKCCEQIIFSLKLENQQLKEFVLHPKIHDAGTLDERKFRFAYTGRILRAPLKTVFNYCPELPPGRYKAPIYIQNDSFLI